MYIDTLVGGDLNMTFIFPYIGNIIIPIDYYFSEGLKPPTSLNPSTSFLERSRILGMDVVECIK